MDTDSYRDLKTETRADREKSDSQAETMEGAVSCDYCVEGSLGAVKTCLTCQSSFCEEHLRPHKENALLRAHQLVEATGRMAEMLCAEHARLLDFYCEREQRPVCHECSVSAQHRDHRHATLAETCSDQLDIVVARLRLVENTSGLLLKEAAALKEEHADILSQSEQSSCQLSRAFEEAQARLSRDEAAALEEMRTETQLALGPVEAAMEDHAARIALLSRVKDGLQALLAPNVEPIVFIKMVKDQHLNEDLQTNSTYRRNEIIDKSLKEIVKKARTLLTPGMPTLTSSDDTPLPTIPWNAVTLKDLLKLGAFSDIHRGLYENRQVAVKIQNNSITAEQLMDEARTMGALRHQRLLPLIAAVSELPGALIVEFMSNGNLFTFLKKKTPANRERYYLRMAAEVAEGMRFLEAEGYVHLDLRAANVLLDSGFGCKIAGFQLVRRLTDGVYHICGGDILPARWCAVETFTTKDWTSKCDSWSFGILLFEIYTDGTLPYEGKTNMEVVELLEQGTRLSRPSDCPDVVHLMMTSCWKENPLARPDFDKICSSLSSLIQAETPS